MIVTASSMIMEKYSKNVMSTKKQILWNRSPISLILWCLLKSGGRWNALTSLCELFAYQLTPRDVPDSMSAQIQNMVLKNKGKKKLPISKLFAMSFIQNIENSCQTKKMWTVTRWSVKLEKMTDVFYEWHMYQNHMFHLIWV